MSAGVVIRPLSIYEATDVIDDLPLLLSRLMNLGTASGWSYECGEALPDLKDLCCLINMEASDMITAFRASRTDAKQFVAPALDHVARLLLAGTHVRSGFHEELVAGLSRVLVALFTQTVQPEHLPVESHSVRQLLSALQASTGEARLASIIGQKPTWPATLYPVINILCTIMVRLCLRFSDDKFQERHYTEIDALFELEEALNAYSDVVAKHWGSEQYVTLMRGFFEILREMAGQAIGDPQLRRAATATGVRKRIFEVMCARLMAPKDRCPLSLRRGIFWQLTWLATQAARGHDSLPQALRQLHNPSSMWTLMQKTDPHVLWRLLEILPKPLQGDDDDKTGRRFEWVVAFLYQARPAFSAFDKRTSLHLIATWWKELPPGGSSPVDWVNSLCTTIRTFESYQWGDNAGVAVTQVVEEYVAEVNESGDLPFYIDAERGMLVEVLDYHRGVAPWQDMWQHRTRGPLFLTTAWTSNQFALPGSKTLLDELMEGSAASEYISTLHAFLYSGTYAAIKPLKSKGPRGVLSAFATVVPQLLAFTKVADPLLDNAAHWREMEEALLLLADLLQILTFSGQLKPGSDMRRIWVQKSANLVDILDATAKLLTAFASLPRNRLSDRSLVYAANLLAARFQAIGVLMVRASPSPAYRGKEETVEEGLDAVLGCSAILPLTLLPRMLEPHPEEQRLEHLEKVEAMANRMFGGGKSGSSSPPLQSAGQAGAQDAKAAAKASKKERQRRKREMSLAAPASPPAFPTNAIEIGPQDSPPDKSLQHIAPALASRLDVVPDAASAMAPPEGEAFSLGAAPDLGATAHETPCAVGDTPEEPSNGRSLPWQASKAQDAVTNVGFHPTVAASSQNGQDAAVLAAPGKGLRHEALQNDGFRDQENISAHANLLTLLLGEEEGGNEGEAGVAAVGSVTPPLEEDFAELMSGKRRESMLFAELQSAVERSGALQIGGEPVLVENGGNVEQDPLGLLLWELDRLFRCPLTQKPLIEAVVAEDGCLYESTAIQAWLAQGNRTSPCTGAPIGTLLFPSHAVRKACSLLRDHLIQYQ